MRIADNILKAGALLYLMCVVLDSVFLFPDYNLVIENILFPIGLLYTIRVLVLNTSAFLVIFPLLLLFLWELLSTSIIHSRTGMEDLMYLFRLLKLPVVFTITLNALDSRFFSPDCMVRSGFYLLSAISLFIVLDPFGYGSM